MIILGYIGGEIKNKTNLKNYKEIHSKLGGSPDFLASDRLHVNCAKCNIQLKFTLQLYTPYSTLKNRALYLFYCENNQCNATWSVFRSSIESNAIKTTETPLHELNEISTDDWLKSAGIDVNTTITNQNPRIASKFMDQISTDCKLTEKCYLIKYLSENNIDNSDRKVQFLLNSYISNVDNDPIDITRSFESDISSDRSNIEDLDPMSVDESSYVSDKDKYLHHFTAEISNFPKQIIRYNFGGVPLFSESPKKINIPSCRECGSNKVFEFQVISTIIYEWESLFGEKSVFVKCNSDWSTIIVYTCSKDCNVELSEESIILQYIK